MDSPGYPPFTSLLFDGWQVSAAAVLQPSLGMLRRYRTVAERLVGARLVPQHRLGGRGSMPFDFLSQQLVFSGIAVPHAYMHEQLS